jgi:Leucine-rich repeat (LRR) protein
MHGNNATDFSPLAECVNLRDLDLRGAAVADLGFLRPLKLCSTVYLSNTPVTDISVLGELPALDSLLLPWGARDVEKLRQFPKLRRIGYDGASPSSAEEFWRMHAELPWLPELGAKGITVKTLRRNDGLWSVSIRNPLLEDLSALRGSPLHALDIMDSKVASLEPLRGMPLTDLAIGNSKVTDLSPLAGMKLETFQAGALRNLKDISVLRGMPLRVIYIEGVSVGLDLAPLADCETLEVIRIPKGAKSIEPLRQLPRLRRIGYDFDDRINERIETERFWAAYDRAKKP